MSVASSEDLIDLTTETNVRLPTQTLVAEAHALQKLQDALLLAPTKDAALEIALSAAELSMRALKLAKDPATRKSMSTKVKSLLEQAEQIKRDDCWQPKPKSTVVKPFHVEFPNASAIKKLEEPVSLRQQSTAEKILLMKASQLNGFKFPPWQRPPADTEFNLGPGETPFQYVVDCSLRQSHLTYNTATPLNCACPLSRWKYLTGGNQPRMHYLLLRGFQKVAKVLGQRCQPERPLISFKTLPRIARLSQAFVPVLLGLNADIHG